jgi:hypothetical protein
MSYHICRICIHPLFVLMTLLGPLIFANLLFRNQATFKVQLSLFTITTLQYSLYDYVGIGVLCHLLYSSRRLTVIVFVNYYKISLSSTFSPSCSLFPFLFSSIAAKCQKINHFFAIVYN